MKFKERTKWEQIVDGFENFWYCLDNYNDGDFWGYDEFWEGLSIGWLNMEDDYKMYDPYNLSGRDSYYSYVMENK
tara:strand:- start:56 stop:280 length:225 start_codon:yes stop_codon:yes gene_type:complete